MPQSHKIHTKNFSHEYVRTCSCGATCTEDPHPPLGPLARASRPIIINSSRCQCHAQTSVEQKRATPALIHLAGASSVRRLTGKMKLSPVRFGFL